MLPLLPDHSSPAAAKEIAPVYVIQRVEFCAAMSAVTLLPGDPIPDGARMDGAGKRYSIENVERSAVTAYVNEDNQIVVNKQIFVPQIGSIVTGKVIRISRMHATLEILVIDDETVPYPFTGTIRKLDVRQTDIDNIRMETCFLPGDVVKAEVISLGDRRNYMLSTAKTDLGVTHATSNDGNDLKPCSYSEMIDAVTGEKESRKVAMPVEKTINCD